MFLLSRRVAGEVFSAFGALLRAIWAPLGRFGRLLVSLGRRCADAGHLFGGQGSHLGGLGAPSGPLGEVLVPLREALGTISGKSAVKRSSPTAVLGAMRFLIEF